MKTNHINISRKIGNDCSYSQCQEFSFFFPELTLNVAQIFFLNEKPAQVITNLHIHLIPSCAEFILLLPKCLLSLYQYLKVQKSHTQASYCVVSGFKHLIFHKYIPSRISQLVLSTFSSAFYRGSMLDFVLQFLSRQSSPTFP